MKYCCKCGACLKDTDQFCPKCGTKVRQEEEQKETKKHEKRKKRIAIFVCAAVVVSMVGGSVWGINNWLHKKNKTEKESGIPAKSNEQDTLYPYPYQGKWGFVNKDKEWVIEPQYEFAYNFETYGDEQYAHVAQGNGYGVWQYGLINLKNEEVLPIQYAGISILEKENGDVIFSTATYDGEGYIKDRTETVAGGNGLSTIEVDEKFQRELMDQNGEVLTKNYEFNKITTTNRKNIYKYEVINADEYDRTYGYLSADGKILTSKGYENIEKFGKNGFALAESKEHLYGFLNEEGEEVIPCIYDNAGNFAENGLAYIGVEDADGNIKYGYINETGEEVIPVQYTNAGEFMGNGLAYVAKKNASGEVKYGYINEKGEEVIPCQYEDAGDFSNNGLAYVGLDNEDENILYGYINEEGEVVIDFQYIKARKFGKKNYAYVKKMDEQGEKQAGFIDSKGRWIEAKRYDMLVDYQSLTGYKKNDVDTWLGWINYDDQTQYDLIQDGEVIASGIDDIPILMGEKILVAVSKEDGKIKYGILNQDGTWFMEPDEDSWMYDVLQKEIDSWYRPTD